MRVRVRVRVHVRVRVRVRVRERERVRMQRVSKHACGPRPYRAFTRSLCLPFLQHP